MCHGIFPELGGSTIETCVSPTGPHGFKKRRPAELLGICPAIMSENATWDPDRSRLRTKPVAATTDEHKLTQIEINNPSVFIRVHLWLILSFSKCRERLPKTHSFHGSCFAFFVLFGLFRGWKKRPDCARRQMKSRCFNPSE